MRARGFTLVEMLVVLLVLAVAAGVTAPSVGRAVDGVRARAEVASFAAFLRYARHQAVTKRVAHEVRVDPDAHLLTLSPAGAERPSMTRRLGERLRVKADSPAGLTVRFLPEGLSSGASFHIEAPGPRVFVITVEPLTGRVAEVRRDA